MSNYIDKCPKCNEDAFHHWDYKRKWQEKCLACGYEPEYEAQIADLEAKLELAEKKYKRLYRLYRMDCEFGERYCNDYHTCRECLDANILNDELWSDDGSLK